VSSAVEFVDIDWAGRPLSIEYRWIGAAASAQPLIVFLHEGLGSLAMWKDFPERLCAAANCRGLVYSRPGYGASTPRAAGEKWGVDFMHRQAYEVLPALLDALGVDTRNDPPWLFGHSDGGSIALLYAARFANAVAGLVVLSPHIMVEDLTLESIEQARRVYLQTDLQQKLGRYHADPESAFWGWNDIWLLPAFREWTIEDEITSIECPLLAVQGIDDEYGTLEQVDGIARRLPQARVVKISDCGHSPHRDQPEKLVRLVSRFIGDTAGTALLARAATGGS
jgi:pimeloyl-ACP methyl ester carboxylesterase